MAKTLGWLNQVRLEGDGDDAVVVFRIRWWHPGLWWALARTIAAEVCRRIEGGEDDV